MRWLLSGLAGRFSFVCSFLFAGASAVLMSLWPVDDEATSQLMLRFYRHLGNGEKVAGALRLAKMEMIGSRTFSHPYFWAGFIVTGAAGQILAPGYRIRGILVPGGISLIVLLSFGLIFRRKRWRKSMKSSKRRSYSGN